ncbi:MAG TPA: hypothetical protein VFF28_07980 [Candidatus Nanoarchaeia archaeon]|nr:hypothetical protein [Candidatus Nanoarchaeia archaeon]
MLSQASLDRLKAKQLELRHLKLKHYQEDFDKYIASLFKDEQCQYMTGISGIISLCNNNLECKFKGEVYKSFTAEPKRECSRERALRFEKMLEH